MKEMSEETKRLPPRRYSEELKADCAKLVLDEGRPIAQVARELELTKSRLFRSSSF